MPIQLQQHPLFHFIAVGCVLLCVTGCTGSETGSGTPQEADRSALSGRLFLSGSSTVAPLAAEIAREFERRHPGVRIDVQAGGSGKGIADARTGQADIGMASRALESDEKDLVSHRIAVDGVGLIVHRSNPMTELSADQVVSVFTGQTHNWLELGGPDLAITVIHKAEGRATLEVFLKHFGLENPEIRPDVIAGHNEQAIQSVANSAGAIGYVSIGTAEADIAAGVPIRLLPLNGVAASSKNVAAGVFPMSRPLNLVTGLHPSSLAQAFIEFAQSQAVHENIRQQYFVPASH